jgi:hypothetical protein
MGYYWSYCVTFIRTSITAGNSGNICHPAGSPQAAFSSYLPMIRVNAFALCRYKPAGKGKMPHYLLEQAGKGRAAGSGNILVFPAGADH